MKGLKWWQQLQGRLVAIAMLAAIYLLSELGVEGEEKNNVLIAGSIGLVCSLLAALLSIITLNRIHQEHAQRQPSDLELSHNVRSKRTFTTSDVEEGMIII